MSKKETDAPQDQSLGDVLRGATAADAEMREGPNKSIHAADLVFANGFDLSPSRELHVSSIPEIADTQYFGATDGLARYLTAKLAEVDQRLHEIASDLEISASVRDAAIRRAQIDYDAVIALLHDQAMARINGVIENYLEETSVARGRETDLIKAKAQLEASIEALKR